MSLLFLPRLYRANGWVDSLRLPQAPGWKTIVNKQDMPSSFCFCYPNAPIRGLINTCNSLNSQGNEISIGLAGNSLTLEPDDCASAIPFVAQSEFDKLLAQYDMLFVRGEDSFVRAQLAGKPFIWQIYPTEDNAHFEKLACFLICTPMGLARIAS